MKTFSLYFCLMIALALPLISIAGELPRVSLGHSVIHGGNPHFAKAGGDTINLMAATLDPTNTANEGPCHGVEPYYDGDFEEGWNGWTHYDITQPTVTHWNVSTYNQVGGNYAAWAGSDIVTCGGTDPEGGYGNAWHDLINFQVAVGNPGVSSAVTVTATLQHDSEPGYDYTYLSYQFSGQPYGDMGVWDGANTGNDVFPGAGISVTGSVTFLPPEYIGGNNIAVFFRFKSDGAWSDEDCLYPSHGACQVDDINVRVVNDGNTTNYFEDFEHGGDPDNFGIWTVAYPTGVGDYAALYTGLEDADPCATNYTQQVAFIDDGVVVPGTGGSQCINWCYGPGGYIVTTTGGLAGETEHIHNAIVSPVLDWPQNKDCTTPDYDGCILTFSAYSHEDLSADSPGIFYTWGVRSADTDGDGGNGIQDINDQGWSDRNFVYYGGPYYVRGGDNVTDLMNPGRDEVQVQLAVYELGYAWFWTGNDGYPAPYFDNVTVKVFPYQGPGMSSREIDRAQDNWPARGTIDYGDLGSHSVRFDMALNISGPTHLRNDPGDSMVIDITPVRAGSDFSQPIRMHYILDANPIFTPAMRTAGWPDQGVAIGEPAVGLSGEVTIGKWAFDCPDTGFLFPGDVLHYYIEAYDAIGGAGGTDEQVTIMPADTTGYSDGFGDPMGYASGFTVRALPSLRAEGGGYTHPQLLFWNDFTNRGGGENEWYTALNNIGLLVEEDYDVYYTNGPSSGVGNGIGGRTNDLMLAGYTDMLYTSGSHGVNTISNGDFQNDAGDDVGVLINWIDQGGKDIFLTGDDLGSDLAQAGSVTLQFLEDYMGVTVATDNVRPFIANQTTPRVDVVPGNPVWLPGGTLDHWIAFGGCFGINTFDGVEVFGGGQRIATFEDPSGAGYTFSAATLNTGVGQQGTSSVLSMPYDLMFVYSDPAEGGDLSARARLLRDVLSYFGIDGDGQNVSGVGDVQKIAFAISNYPNPFNPSTTLTYSLPRAGHFKLSIYNVRGQLVRTLIDGPQPAGANQEIVWDGTDNQGSSVSSGVYFYEARTGGEVKVQKMALVK